MRVAILEPHKSWRWADIEPGLKALQAIVGGLIELVPLHDDIATVYINEEGKLLELPANAAWMYDGKIADIIVGPIVVLGPVNADGEDTELTPEVFEIVSSERIIAVPR